MDPGKVSAGIGSSAPGGGDYWMAPRVHRAAPGLRPAPGPRFKSGSGPFQRRHRWMSTVRSGRATDL